MKWRSVFILMSVGILLTFVTLAVANPVTADQLPASASYELQCEGEEVLLAVTVSNTSEAEEIYANARFESGSEMDVFIDTFIGPQQSVTESLAKPSGTTGSFVLEVYDEDVQNMETLFNEELTFECEETEDPTEDPTEEPTTNPCETDGTCDDSCPHRPDCEEESTEVPWNGQGTDSIVECDADQEPYIHWVLSAGGNDATFTSAALVTDGVEVGEFEQKGQGAWHLTTTMLDLESDIVALVDGEPGNSLLVISDACMAEEPEPEPTETETEPEPEPTETETEPEPEPTETETEPEPEPTETETEPEPEPTETETEPEPEPTETETEPEPEPTETETEELGPASQVEKEVPARDELPHTGLAETLLAVSLGLLVTGGLTLFATRRRSVS